MDNNWIKAYIVDILPCIIALVYTLAIVYNVAYFSVYGINVIHYLSLTEMLMSIIEPLIFVVLITFLMSWLTLMSVEYSVPIIHEEEQRVRKWITNNRVYKFALKLWNSSFVKTIRNFIIFRWLRKIRERNSKYDKDKPYSLVIIVFLFVVLSFLCYLSFLQSVGKESGIHLAAIALALPPILLISYIDMSFLFDRDYIFFEEIKKVTSLEIVSAIFLYYLFGIVVFYKNGLDSGEYNLYHNQTKFEIKTADGSMFTNEKFGYVEQLNDHIFLFEKGTGEVVILSKSNLNYTKIDFTKTQKGLIPSLVGSFDQIFLFKNK